MVHTIPYSARISDTVFPSAPPVRKISGGSHFLTLHRVEEIDNVIEEYKQNIKTDKREEEIGAVFASISAILSTILGCCVYLFRRASCGGVPSQFPWRPTGH